MSVSVGENQIQRIIQDLKDAISELSREHKENGEPITDDNTNLQKCCLKLEYLLQFDQKEKTSFLGNKRDYWDFFCCCLAKVKGANDGIRFVKSIPELKTSLGKGRAFIRYSLVHQRLADTFQQCLMNIKVTSDWFYARSPLLKPHLVSDIVIHLYELNEVHFDLASRGHDLDATWPTFSRRSFCMSYSPSHHWKPPSRCSSISSLVSNYSQAPEILPNQEINNSLTVEQLETLDELRVELDQSNVNQKEVQEKIQQIELEKKDLQKKIMLHEQTLETLKKSAADTMEENLMLKQTVKELSQQCAEFAQGHEEELQKSLQLLEVSSSEKQQALQSKVTELETCNEHYAIKLQSLTQETERIKSSEGVKNSDVNELQAKLIKAEQKNVELVERIENILTEKEQLTSTHCDLAQKIHKLLDKLNDAEREEVGTQRLNNMQELQLEKVTNDFKSKDSVIDELELKLKEITLKLENKSVMLVKNDEELESYLNKSGEIRNAQESETTECESLQKAIQEQRNEEDEAQFKCKALDEQTNNISNQLTINKSELTAAVTEVQSLQEVQNKVFCENEDLRKKLQDSEELLANGQSSAKHMKVEHQKFEIENKKLQDIVQKNMEREKEMERACLALEAEIDRLSTSEKYLQGQIADAMVPVDEKEKKLREENRQLNEKLQNALWQFKKAEPKVKESQSELDELKQEKIKLNDCLLNLQADLHIKEEVISDLENKLFKLQHNENSPISLVAEEEVNLSNQLSENIEKCQAKIEILEEKLSLDNNFQQHAQFTDNLIDEKNALVKALVTERDIYKKEMQKINMGLVSSKIQLEVEQSEVSRLQGEVEELRSKLKYAIEEKESIYSNLDLAVCSKEEYRTLVQNLKEQIESNNRDHAEKLLMLKEKEDYLKRERENLAQQIIELEEQFATFKEESSQQKKLIEKLKSENVETKDLLKRENTEMAELGIQICTLNAEKNATEKKYNYICQQQTAYFDKMKLEQNQLNVNVSALRNENEHLKEELKKSEDLATTIKEFQRKLVKTEQKAENLKEAAREEMSAVKFQMSGELMDYQNKLKTAREELETVRKDLNESQSQIASLDKQLIDFQDLNSKLKEQLEQKVQIFADLQLLIKEEQEKFKSLSENFISNQQELEVVKKEQEEYKQHQEEMQVEMKRNEQKLVAEVDDLNRTKEFLEERLIELIKDKDALWQKSDALEFEQKLRNEARWLGDREVIYCQDCQSQFTWWLRRHHCRLCGRIFCYYCCNCFVITKHNRKRERCCKACYAEHSAVVQRLNDPGLSDTTNSPDESPSRSVSERQISRSTESFAKPDDATFDIITDEELNEIEDNDCSLESTKQSTQPESTLQETPSLSPAHDASSVDGARIPTEDGTRQPMQDAEINLLKCGEMTLKIPFTVEEIQQFGNSNREIFIKSSCYSLISITVEECGLTIGWVFSSDPKSISFSIVYQDSEEMSYEHCKVLIPLTRCNSHKETIHSQMKVRNPGQYLLIFDNSFSRFTSKTVFYRLTVEKSIIYDGSDVCDP